MKYQGVLFRTFNGNSYIYDNMTATSFRIPDCVDTPKQFLKFIDKKRSFENHKLKKIMVHNNNAFYRRMQKQYGAFTESILPHPSKTTVDEVKKFIDNECFFQLILVVTDDCNLRCKYCFFSDAYPYTRNRLSNQMSLMTAKKAIDYFFTKIERIHQRYPGRKACITFYGGEPLLNFDLIQSVIEYVKTRYSNNILYSLSTNGTLLSSDKLKFLVDNNVNIFISLDGPQEEHDRLRVYPNNKGSFAEVYNHCVNIKEKYPKYRRVMLLCTGERANVFSNRE